MRERPRNWTDGWAAPVLVALAAFAPAVLALTGGFVFDDDRFIVKNPFIQETQSWLAFFTDGTSVDPVGKDGIFRPLRAVEFALDRVLFGADTLGFHLHSLLWHVVSAVLLLAILRRLLGDARVAFAAALVWAVHPAHVESVAWISSRGDVAMGACVLASVLFALRSSGRDANFAASLAAAAVATLYKETALALPIVIAVLGWLKFARVPWWPYLVVSVAYFVYREQVLAGPIGHGVTFVLGGSTVGTFATMVRGFGFYVADVVLPVPSTDWYLMPSTSFADGAVLLWLSIHAALVVSAVRARHAAPLFTLAVAWFYAFLLPVSNWPFFGGIPTAERFLYLPVAGAAVALGAMLRCAPRGAWAASLVAAAALAASSIDRSRTWRTEDGLWDAILADHDSPRGHATVGNRLRTQALEVRSRASKLPDGPAKDALTAEKTRLLETSLDHLHRALGLWYDFELSARSKGNLARESEINAANVAFLLGRDAEAVFHADEAILIPGRREPAPYYTRGLALLELGFAPQAMASMDEARAAGFDDEDTEIAYFFLRAAAACEADSMPSAAEAGYVAAVKFAPAGPIRDQGNARLAALRARSRPADSAARERARIAALDAALDALPRGCPARGAH